MGAVRSMSKYKIGVCSFFRDSMNWYGHQINHVHNYFSQIGNQENAPEDIAVFVLEGDSKDNTYETLLEYQKIHDNIFVIKDNVTFDVPVASTLNSNRFEQLSRLGNILFNASKWFCDYIVWIESDLLIPNNLLHSLLADIQFLENTGIVAPITMLKTQNQFYDTWGFINMDGSTWDNGPPFSKVLDTDKRFIQMLSVGSCMIIDAKVLRDGASVGTNGCFRELCRQTCERAYNIYIDKQLTVWHPSSEIVVNRWI